jgi:C_GCAxxG_C_C family probable redox protein
VKMETKNDIAVRKLIEGYNCAQSILYSFCSDFRIDQDTALKLSCGFGAGMGRKGEVCGAVTGGIIVIGLKYGRGEDDDTVAKETTYAKTLELMERFSAKHGTFLCRKLLNGCDLTTDEGQQYFKENDLLNNACKVCVESVVKILEEML